MATTIAKAYVQIMPSADGIKSKLTSVLNSESQGAGDGAGLKIGSAIKKGIAAAGIGTAIKAAIGEGAALEQSLGGVETLFKNNADTVKKYATEAYKTAGVSANSYMEQVTSFSASLLQGLGGDTEKAAVIANRAVIDMADNANKFGTDVASIQNAYQGFAKGNFTMLDNLKLGYGGTKSEMARLINDTGVLGDTMVTLGKKGNFDEVVTFDKMIEAIHKVQTDLDVTGTTSKEAASTFSGSFASMQAAAQNLMGNIAIGGEISDSTKALADSMNTFVFGNFIPMLGNIVSALPAVAGQFADAGINWMNSLAQGFSGNVTTFINNLMPMLVNITSGLESKAGQLVTAGCNLLLKMAEGFANAMPSIVSNLPVIITNIANVINNNAPKLIITGVKIIATLIKGIVKATPTIVASIPKIIKAMVAVWSAFNWTSLGRKALTTVKKGLESAGGSIPAYLKSLGQKAISAFKSINWGEVGKNIVRGIASGIGSMGGVLANAARSVASNALGAIKAKLGIHSPSRVFRDEVGKNISLGIAEGIDMHSGAVGKSLEYINGKSVAAFKYAGNAMSANDGRVVELLEEIADKDTDVSFRIGDREFNRRVRKVYS